MHPSLIIADTADLVVDIIAAEPDDSRVKTLGVCRLLTRTMHARATHHLFHAIHILSTDKLAAMLDILRSTSIAPKITALTIGLMGHVPPHTPSLPLPHVDYGVLAEVIQLLPSLQSLRIGAVNALAVFRLPSHGAGPDHARPSYAAILSSSSMQADPLAELPWQSVRVLIPTSSACVGAAEAGVLAGHLTAYANIVRLNESEMPENLAVVLAAGSSVLAFYGGTVSAFINFGTFVLPSLDHVLRSLTVSWTAAHALRHNNDMIEAMRTGISSCTHLEHLTLSLFIGSTAPISGQWEVTLSILAAANHATLRTLTLIIALHKNDAVEEHLRGFETVEWVRLAHLLSTQRCPNFEAVAFSVVDAGPDVVERIEWEMRHGLGHSCRVRRSGDVMFAAFS